MAIQLTGTNLDLNTDNGLLVDNNVVNTDPTVGYVISVTADTGVDPNTLVRLRDANTAAGAFNAALDLNSAPGTSGGVLSGASVALTFNELIANYWATIEWSHDVARYTGLFGTNKITAFVDLNDDGNYTSGTDYDLGFWGYQSVFGLNSLPIGAWNTFGQNKDLTTLSAVDRALINGHKLGLSILVQEGSTGAGTNLAFDNFAAGYTILAVPVCFTRGTKITTDRGEMVIEDLCPGDLILTMDRGFQSIRWIGSTRFSAAALRANPKLTPVTIQAGAMGRGLPHTNLRVSPQHRMLLASRIVERMTGDDEVLVPAIKLVGTKGITQIIEGEVEYFHILFDHHEIIYANGTPAESLYLGEGALAALSEEARLEIYTIFPELVEQADVMLSARTFLSKKPVIQTLLKRMQSHDYTLLEM